MNEPTIKTLGIHFGLLSDPISRQLSNQQFRFVGARVKVYEQQARQILALWMAGILSDKEKQRAHGRLFKVIKEHVLENMKPVKA